MEQFSQISQIAKPELRENLDMPNFTVVRLSEGLTFGEGSISGTEEEPKLLALMDDTIHNSPAIIVPVEAEDDGCSDGRETIQVFTVATIFKHGLNRAKVFGGSVAMAAASNLGLGRAHNKPLQQVFIETVDSLQAKGINFGAHTDEHAHGPNCGCGAIDKAPEALVAILKFEEPIRKVVTVLGVDSKGVDEVFDNFRTYVRDTLSEPAEYKGQEIIECILAAGKVLKRLGGDHRERRIVLNQVKGYTVNQRLIRMVTGGRGQVFAADIWRLEDIALKLYPDQPDLQHKSFLSELIYTLGVSAVLTKGDLPVDMIQPSVRTVA